MTLGRSCALLGLQFPSMASLVPSVPLTTIAATLYLPSQLFFNGKKPLAEGESLLWPALAHTMDTVAEKGADEFYEGSLAEDLLADLAVEGGLPTLHPDSRPLGCPQTRTKGPPSLPRLPLLPGCLCLQKGHTLIAPRSPQGEDLILGSQSTHERPSCWSQALKFAGCFPGKDEKQIPRPALLTCLGLNLLYQTC